MFMFQVILELHFQHTKMYVCVNISTESKVGNDNETLRILV